MTQVVAVECSPFQKAASSAQVILTFWGASFADAEALQVGFHYLLYGAFASKNDTDGSSCLKLTVNKRSFFSQLPPCVSPHPSSSALGLPTPPSTRKPREEFDLVGVFVGCTDAVYSTDRFGACCVRQVFVADCANKLVAVEVTDNDEQIIFSASWQPLQPIVFLNCQYQAYDSGLVLHQAVASRSTIALSKISSICPAAVIRRFKFIQAHLANASFRQHLQYMHRKCRKVLGHSELPPPEPPSVSGSPNVCPPCCSPALH